MGGIKLIIVSSPPAPTVIPPAEERRASHLCYINKLPFEDAASGFRGVWNNDSITNGAIATVPSRSLVIMLLASASSSCHSRHTFLIKLYPQPFTLT